MIMNADKIKDKYLNKNEIIEYMQNAKAYIFVAEEDFGILPVEAQACGTPVIAFGKGGVTETIIEHKTDILFYRQTVESLIKSIKEFENNNKEYNPKIIRNNAERFSQNKFRSEFKKFVNKKCKEFYS